MTIPTETLEKWIVEIKRHGGISCGSDEIIPLFEELIQLRRYASQMESAYVDEVMK